MHRFICEAVKMGGDCARKQLALFGIEIDDADDDDREHAAVVAWLLLSIPN